MTSVEIARVIDRLKAWRQDNGLSQAGAVVVMRGLGFEIRQSTLEKWESKKLRPGRFTVQVLAMFLEKHPQVECPPGYRTQPAPLPAKTVKAIVKAREAGETLRSIADRFGLSESGVSRIAKKNRRAKASV